MVSSKKELNLKKQATIRQEIENLIGIFQQAGSNAAFLEIQDRQKELQKLMNQPMYQSDMPNITNYDKYINSQSNPIPVRGRPKKEVIDKPIEIIQPSKPRGRPPKPKAEEEYKEPKPRGRPKKNNVNEVLILQEKPQPQKKLKIGVKQIKETESKIQSQEDSINRMLELIENDKTEIKKIIDRKQTIKDLDLKIEAQKKELEIKKKEIKKAQEEIKNMFKKQQKGTTKESKTKKPKAETYERYYNALQRLFKAPEFPEYTKEKLMENINNREKMTVNQIKSVFQAAVAYYEKFRAEVQSMREDNEMALNDGDEDAIDEDEFENVIFDFESEYYAPSWDYFINFLGETESPKLKPKEIKPKKSKKSDKLKIGVKQIKETESKIKSQEDEINRMLKDAKDFERELRNPPKVKQQVKESSNISLDQKRKKLIDNVKQKIKDYGPDKDYDNTIRFFKNMSDIELKAYNPQVEGYQLSKLSKNDISDKRQKLIKIAEGKKQYGDKSLYDSKIRLFKIMSDDEIKFYNVPSDLIPFGSKGSGIFTFEGLNKAFEGVDWTANRLKSSLKGYVMGRGDAYPPYVKTIIEKYGDQEIVGLTLSRNPLDSAIINFLNVLSLGKLNKRLERAGYDKMFHLRLNVKLQNGKTISIEKNPLINMEVSPKNLPKAEFKEVYNIPQGITLFNLLEAAQSKMGSKYFTYSTSTNNCQNYVMNLLSASNIGDTEDIAFLKQDVEQLFQKYGYLKNLTDKITDTAARANEIYYGAGFCC